MSKPTLPELAFLNNKAGPGVSATASASASVWVIAGRIWLFAWWYHNAGLTLRPELLDQTHGLYIHNRSKVGEQAGGRGDDRNAEQIP